MKRIDTRLENWESVYSEVERQKTSRGFALGFSALLRCVYAPAITYAEGAEERISELAEQGTTFIYALNHRSEHDPNVAQAAVFRSPPLRPRIGSTNVLAKSPLFEGGRFSLTPQLTRRMGGIPVYRRKDHLTAPEQYLRDAGEKMSMVAAQGLVERRDLAVFPEGTCNEDDPRRLLMVNSGLAHIAHQALAIERESNPDAEPWFAFLPVGISYGVKPQPDFWQARRATVAFGMPIENLEKKPFLTRKVIQEGMQGVLTVAHEEYYTRRDEVMPEEYHPLVA